ncbi:hypothetical protein CPC08DRAFT_226658 [Agrocybe pediades]|nr:hypothetical protein CPC08DRAFT_226658 [Agrocybe pediades]
MLNLSLLPRPSRTKGDDEDSNITMYMKVKTMPWTMGMGLVSCRRPFNLSIAMPRAMKKGRRRYEYTFCACISCDCTSHSKSKIDTYCESGFAAFDPGSFGLILVERRSSEPASIACTGFCAVSSESIRKARQREGVWVQGRLRGPSQIEMFSIQRHLRFQKQYSR